MIIYEYAGFKYEIIGGLHPQAIPVEGQHPAAAKQKHRKAAVECWIEDGKPGGVQRLSMDLAPGQICEWFLLCNREAVVFVEHPIIGPVPCCQRCADWYARMGQQGKEVGHGGKA